MLLRLAASARRATPPLFETLLGLGRELVRRRIRSVRRLRPQAAGARARCCSRARAGCCSWS